MPLRQILRYAHDRGKRAAESDLSPALPPVQLLYVFVGGGVGAIARLQLIRLLERSAWLDLTGLGVLGVNLLGCFLAGIVTVLWSQGPVGTALSGGFLGGFTTYGAFSVLLVQLAREGALVSLASQLAGHVLGGVVATIAGMALATALRSV